MRAGGIFGGDSLGADDVGPTTASIPTEIVANVDPLMVPCVSKEVIEDVQTLLGTKSTGIWKCEDGVALSKSGKTFKQLAPDCTGPTPLLSPGACTVVQPEPTGPMISEGTKTKIGASGVLFLLGASIATLYLFWPKAVKTNPRKRRAKKRSEAQLWDLLWENFTAAKRSGNKQRILATAELLEGFDKARGWKPMISVAKVKRDYGW
jgi:hypothetical protein